MVERNASRSIGRRESLGWRSILNDRCDLDLLPPADDENPLASFDEVREKLNERRRMLGYAHSARYAEYKFRQNSFTLR